MLGSNITMKVEFNAGCSIESAIYEAKQKSFIWQVGFVSFLFNGVEFNISPEANVEECVRKFKEKDFEDNLIID